jgi:hypothetical protein
MTESQEKNVGTKTGGGQDEYKQTPVASIVSALLTVAVITIAIFVAKAYYSQTEKTPPKIVATAIEPKSEVEEAREQEEAEAQKKAAAERAAEEAEAAEKSVYAGRLAIKRLRVKKTRGGDIAVSGSILNVGNREVKSVSLVLYCLDAGDRPVCEKKLRVAPAAGGSFRKHQRLPFKTEIVGPPERTKDVAVVITDMSFSD